MNQNQEEQKQKDEQVVQIINNFMDNNNLYEHFIQTLKDRNINMEDIDYLQMTEILHEMDHHIIENIVEEVENLDFIEEMKEDGDQENKDDVQIDTEGKQQMQSRQLILKFLHGKEFIKFKKLKLQEKEELKFIICANFVKERQESKKYDIATTFQFDDMFVFNLNFDKYNLNSTDTQTLLNKKEKIEVVILFENKNTLQRDIISCQQIEWRTILSYQAQSRENQPSIQFYKFGTNKEKVGIIEISFETYPFYQQSSFIPKTKLEYTFKEENSKYQHQFDLFYDLAKKWWQDYTEKYPLFADRIIKIFAENEFGIFIPAVSYISPLQNIKGIDSPLQAARFVSLIPYKRLHFGAEERKDIWSKFNTLISRRAGEVADHCILLCSLFLGFGLNAYMVTGKNSEGAYQWVMTIEVIGNNINYIFWDSLTGISYERKKDQAQVLTKFQQIGSIFNRNEFYANIQEDDYADTTDLNLKDQTKWKKISEEVLQYLQPYNTSLQLKPPNINCSKLEKYVEVKLRNHIQDFRMIYGKTTKFDPNFESLMRQELFNREYELEKRHKISKQQSDQFLQAKINYLGNDKTPNPCSFQFQHFDPKRIFLKIKSDKRAEEFLNYQKDRLYFAVKCKIFCYPENFFVLWVLFTLRFQEGL